MPTASAGTPRGRSGRRRRPPGPPRRADGDERPRQEVDRLRLRVWRDGEDERLAAQEVHRQRAGPGRHQRAEQPVPQRSIRGSERLVRSRAAAIGVPNIAPIVPAKARAPRRDRHPRDETEADRHGEADVDGEDRVLRSEADAAGEHEDEGEGETRQDDRRLRRFGQPDGRRVRSAWPGANTITSPTATPVSVRMTTIHAGEGRRRRSRPGSSSRGRPTGGSRRR